MYSITASSMCNRFFSLHTIKSAICLALFTLCIIACQQPDGESSKNNTASEEVTEFFDKVTRIIDSSQMDVLLITLHGEWPRLKNVPDSFLFLKYQYLSMMYLAGKPYRENAWLYADTLEKLLENKAGYQSFKLHAAYTKGALSMLEKNYQAAVNHFYKGRQLISFKEDPCNAFTYLTALSQIQNNFGNYRVAVDYLTQALDYGMVCPSISNEKNTMSFLMIKNDIAYGYEKMGAYDSAVFFLNDALADLSSMNIDTMLSANRAYRIKGILLGNLGGVYYLQNKYTQAEQALRESLLINDQPTREPGDAVYTKIKLANLLLDTDRSAECVSIIDKLLSDSLFYTLPEARRRHSNLAYRYYLKAGDRDKALTFRDKEVFLTDSLGKARAWTSFLPDFNKEFDNLQNKIGVLELEKKQVRQRILLGLFGGVVVISLAIAWSLANKRKQQVEYIERLSELNIQLSEANTQLNLNLNLLEATLKENNMLMRVVAHDLRSPMASMIQLVSLLQDSTNTEEERIQYLDLLDSSCNNALRLIDDIMKSREQPALILADTDIQELINLCIKLQTPQAHKKSLQIITELEPVIIKVDRQKMVRVFLNIIANAIKFSHRGGSINIKLKIHEGHALVTIRDYGVGIPSHIQPNLFNFMPQGGQVGTEGEESFGMGLGISAQVVKEHKGKIWCKSEVGKGTEFFIELPL